MRKPRVHRAPMPVSLATRWLLVGLVLLSALGCSAQPEAVVPHLQPGDAAKQALAEYDRNADGFLDGKELDRCPPLKSTLKVIDRDRDGRLSGSEIEARLRSYSEASLNVFSFDCQVLLDGKPLAGATVRFVPEKFLGATFKPASGVSGDTGQVALEVEGRQGPGVPAGLYRVEVSKNNAQGQETILARYNTQTTLGQEVSPEALGRGGEIVLRLTSR